jgi:hypothetical protein
MENKMKKGVNRALAISALAVALLGLASFTSLAWPQTIAWGYGNVWGGYGGNGWYGNDGWSWFGFGNGGGWGGWNHGYGLSPNTIWQIGYNKGYVDASQNNGYDCQIGYHSVNYCDGYRTGYDAAGNNQQTTGQQEQQQSSYSSSQSNPNIHVTVNNIIPNNRSLEGQSQGGN